jgi:hypothetical protein
VFPVKYELNSSILEEIRLKSGNVPDSPSGYAETVPRAAGEFVL